MDLTTFNYIKATYLQNLLPANQHRADAHIKNTCKLLGTSTISEEALATIIAYYITEEDNLI